MNCTKVIKETACTGQCFDYCSGKGLTHIDTQVQVDKAVIIRIGFHDKRQKEGIGLETEKSLWNDVLDYIRERVSGPTFDTWFKPCKVEIEGEKWFIISPNQFGRDWLEANYLSLVQEAIYESTNEMPEVVFTIVEESARLASPDDKIATILDDINELSLTEQEKLFDLLKRNNSPFSQPVRSEESVRVNQLEMEVEKIKRQLAELNGSIKN